MYTVSVAFVAEPLRLSVRLTEWRNYRRASTHRLMRADEAGALSVQYDCLYEYWLRVLYCTDYSGYIS